MSSAWKTIKVFISSTFRDMHSERDYLVKVVFPQLREKLEKHRLHLVEIDLRWGVTKEQAENDQALGVCLNVIDECRPFFLGILGERYGWIPESFPRDALYKYGWIQFYTGRSITALEIIHGVLRNPEMAGQSYFYFRDPAFMACMPNELRRFMESETPEEAFMQEDLKEEIRRANLPISPMEGYSCRYSGLQLPWRIVKKELSDTEIQILGRVAGDGIITPEEYQSLPSGMKRTAEKYGSIRLTGLEKLGKRVEDDLWNGLKRNFPALLSTPVAIDLSASDAESASFIDEEQEFMERFMESRSQIYAGRETVHESLMQYINGEDDSPMLIHGASGSGKSAVLSKTCKHLADRGNISFVLGHFTGASPRSTNLRYILKRFCLSLKQRFDLKGMEIPENMEELSRSFGKFLKAIPENEKAVIIIDALNQMDKAHRAHQLHWLPRQLPRNVRIILSCIEGENEGDSIIDILRGRNCREMHLESLSSGDRFQIVTEVPSLSAKSLDGKQVDLLLSNPSTGNPLFLLVALQELQGFGSFEFLDERIRQFPDRGDTVTAIFLQVLERLLEDFDPLPVDETLSFIALSRFGLSENELKEITNSGKKTGEFHAILRQIRPYILRRGELIDFFHNNLKKAVIIKFLQDEKKKESFHKRLAEYFESGGFQNERTLSELPYHLTHAGLREKLFSTLTDISFIEEKMKHGMIYGYLEDCRRLEEEREDSQAFIAEIAGIILRSSHILKEYPELTFQQLYNGLCRGERLSSMLREKPEEWRSNYESKGRPWIMMNPAGEIKENEIILPAKDTTSLVFSPCGGCIITGDDKGVIREWSLQWGEINREVPIFDEPVEWLGYSSSGKYLAAAGKHNIAFLKLPGLTEEKRFPFSGIASSLHFYGKEDSLIFAGDDSSVLCLSPDGSVTGLLDGFDPKKTARKYLSLSGRQNGIICMEQNYDDTLSFVFTPENRSISTKERITGSITGMWFNDKFRHASGFSRNGEFLLACGRDGDILLFKTENGDCIFKTKGKIRGALTCSLSGDGSLAAIADESGNVNVRDLERGNMLDSFVMKNCRNLSFHPAGNKLAAAGEELVIRSFGKTPGKSAGEITCMSAFEKKAAAGMADGTIRIYDIGNLNIVNEFPSHDGRITGCALLPYRNGIITAGEDCSLGIWEMNGRKIQFIENAHNSRILSCSTDKEGRYVLTTGQDRRTKIFSPVNGSITAEIRHGEKPSISAVSPDGKMAAVGFKDGTLEIIEIPSLKSITNIKVGSCSINALGWSPSSRNVAAALHDRGIIMCRLSPAPNFNRIFEADEQISNMAFLNDNLLILCGKSRMIKIIDVNSGKITGKFFTQGEFPIPSVTGKSNCMLMGDNTGDIYSLTLLL